MTLELDHVSYAYGKDEVLHRVSTEFGRGVTALLGPNGAGKSTLLELIASVRYPTSGLISLATVGRSDGAGSARTAYRRAVAWLPQTFSAFPGLRVREHVAYSGWLKGMSKAVAWQASVQALEKVGLADRAAERVRRLSAGQQRRVGIAGALVHDAQVILLDEPTAGLDPAQRRRFREVLADFSRERIVILSSHDTDDAYGVFDSVAVLRKGALTFRGSLAEFVSPSSESTDMRDRIEASYLRWAGTED